MTNLTLDIFNQAYNNIVNTWGDLVETNTENDILYITLENKCDLKDNVKIAFDQKQMAIYKVGNCLANCTCVKAHDRIIPLVQRAIVG